MAGGRGERFWPLSRARRPKHLLPIVGDTPLLAQTVERLRGLVPIENILLITNEEQREASLEACPALRAENVFGEPMGRDTAPAVGLAALLVRQRDANGVFAMLPADHVIHDTAGYQETVRVAFEAAERGDALVTIGIKPTFAATGYGYVNFSGDTIALPSGQVHKVNRFVEKPDRARAEAFLQEGSYYWNAGMFFWRADTVLAALGKHAPGLYSELMRLDEQLMLVTKAQGGTVVRPDEKLTAALAVIYPQLTKLSIDYALMEKATNVLMAPSRFDWDDVGEWTAIARHYPADEHGNSLRGMVVSEGSTGNIVITQEGHTVALLGIKDLVVVQTDDATLICPKDRAQEVKKLVGKLRKELT